MWIVYFVVKDFLEFSGAGGGVGVGLPSRFRLCQGNECQVNLRARFTIPRPIIPLTQFGGFLCGLRQHALPSSDAIL